MKHLIILVIALMTTSAFAQNTERQIRRIENLSNRIEREVPYTQATRPELRQAIQLMRQALRIINNDNGGPVDPPPVGSSYICVSRDNDGVAPFSIAVRDSNFDVRKSRHTYQSMNACENAINSIQTIDRVQILCGSRDYDGVGPYALFQINGAEDTKYRGLGFSSINGCERTLSDRVPFRRGSYAVCASRDADGVAPWSVYTIDLARAQVERKQTTYSSYENCRSQLQ